MVIDIKMVVTTVEDQVVVIILVVEINLVPTQVNDFVIEVVVVRINFKIN